MLVKATKKGFYKVIRNIGDTFEYDGKKIGSWMVKVGGKKAPQEPAASAE